MFLSHARTYLGIALQLDSRGLFSCSVVVRGRQAAPFVGGLGYLIAIFVQRKLPQFFAIAYFAAVASVVIPAGLIALQ